MNIGNVFCQRCHCLSKTDATAPSIARKKVESSVTNRNSVSDR